MKLSALIKQAPYTGAISGETHPRYRPDIDGLRAIAVLSVLGYHVFPSLAPGGFVGVDIFFVISGYLISTIIITDAAAGRFSFTTFYARRAKRILPALTSVSVITMIAFSQTFYAPQILQAIQSIAASFLFVANIYFYATTDYFGPSVTQLPFLHYWSLGVEEQYYLLFPLLVLLLRRITPEFQLAIYVLLTLASLIGSQLILGSNPPAAYYLIYWRAWELMLGTISYFIVSRVTFRASIAAAGFWFGIAAITYSLLKLNALSAFPGFNALPSCIGAALVIISGARNQHVGNRLLGSPLPNYVGRISYSLYLVHWPVYVIFSAYLFSGQWFSNPFFILFISFLLAVMNYSWVEQPIRKAVGISNGRILALAASLVGLVLILCLIGFIGYDQILDRARHLHPVK